MMWVQPEVLEIGWWHEVVLQTRGESEETKTIFTQTIPSIFFPAVNVGNERGLARVLSGY